MHKNTERLHKLMRDHRVNCVKVAEILGRKAHTVRVWRVKKTDRPIPDDTLELLAIKLQRGAV